MPVVHNYRFGDLWYDYCGLIHGCLSYSDSFEPYKIILARFMSRENHISHLSLNWRRYRLEVTCLGNLDSQTSK
jgi:hypothetical protein